MDLEETYQGRKPSVGFGRGGPYVRGFRSKPGAAQHDPTSNIPMSRDGGTSQSNWDRVFRNTVSNDFGAGGTNPLHKSKFPSSFGVAGPTGAPSADQLDDPLLQSPGFAGAPPVGWKPGMSLDSILNGPSHQEEWSQPRRSFGWEAASSKTTDSIFDRYKTKDTAGRYAGPGRDAIGSGRGFGWASAFDT